MKLLLNSEDENVAIYCGKVSAYVREKIEEELKTTYGENIYIEIGDVHVKVTKNTENAIDI